MKLRFFIIALLLLLPVCAFAEENQQDVIVLLKEPQIQGMRAMLYANSQEELLAGLSSGIEVQHRYSTINGFSAKVDSETLEKLRENPNVLSVEESIPVQAVLQDSVPLINASQVQALTLSGQNITGTGQTVCVIDSGVDYNHTALGGPGFPNSRVLGGYDFVNSDVDPYDDYGHGTHVAGIVAANGGIIGVAPGVNIVAIKSLDSGGGGISGNVIAGIDWCVANRTVYNISVISMSLGGVNNYSTFCDSLSSSMTAAINSAVASNITVVVATGNAGNYTAISWPSCVTNATRVTATNKADGYASFANRGSGFPDILAAPGVLINSTKLGGGYLVDSGTSMAAPHISGAIALLQQYSQLKSGKALTISEVFNTLNSTGVPLNDSQSGATWQRINVLAAINLMSVPTITVQSPQNGTYYRNGTLNFNITVSEALSAAFVSVDGGANSTLANDTSTHYYNATIPEVANGAHNATFWVNDTDGNAASAAISFIVDSANPSIVLNSPASGSAITRGTNINLTVSDNTQLAIVVYYTTQNSTNITLASPYLINTTNWTKGQVNLTIIANDSAGNVNQSVFPFVVNNSALVVTVLYPNGGEGLYNTTVVNATVTDADGQADIKQVYFYFTNATGTFFIGNTSVPAGNVYNVSWNTLTTADNYLKTYLFVNATDSEATANDTSDSNFSINNVNVAPSVVLTAPVGNETWNGTKTIYWSGSDADGDTLTYYVYYSSNGGLNWTSLTTTSSSSHSWDTTSVSNGAGYRINVTAMDPGGLKASNSSANFTISNSASSNNNQNSGSGAGGMGTSYDITQKFTKINASTPATFTISKDTLALTEISIAVKQNTGGVEIKIKKLAEKPSTIAITPENVYQYLQIDTVNLTTTLSTATIKFKVLKSWVQANSIDPETIILKKWLGSWTSLHTAQEKDDSNYYYFTSNTTTFSVFAISGSKSAEIPVQATTAAPEQQAEPTGIVKTETAKVTGTSILNRQISMNEIIVILALSIIAITGLGFASTRKFRGPKLPPQQYPYGAYPRPPYYPPRQMYRQPIRKEEKYEPPDFGF